MSSKKENDVNQKSELEQKKKDQLEKLSEIAARQIVERILKGEL